MTSKIEWTDETWNPTVGCSRVSAGCENCYAERVAHRGMSASHKGLTVMGKHGPRWTGEVRLIPGRLDAPLRWRKPRKVFVDSMSDLFHESVPFEYIAAVFGVMASCPQHTFQVLTKRPERAREFFNWITAEYKGWIAPVLHTSMGAYYNDADSPAFGRACDGILDVLGSIGGEEWPPSNVWLGTSVESQETAHSRIPHLLDCPAAVRFLSCEPLLGPVDLDPPMCQNCGDDEIAPVTSEGPAWCMMCDSEACFGHWMGDVDRELNWVIVGGEAGPRSRSCDVGWVRSIVEQCKGAGVAVFVKQLGAKPRIIAGAAEDEWDSNSVRFQEHVVDGEPMEIRLKHRKGADPSEWPEALRVQQFPNHEAPK